MISLHLPAPLSVNSTRRMNWHAKPKIDRWVTQADKLVLTQGRRPPAMVGPFEVTLTLSENSRIDADNSCKIVIDYLRRLKLIADDSPKHLRQLTVKFGEAPHGCHIEVKPVGAFANAR